MAARRRSARAATVITLDNHYLHGGQGEMIAARDRASLALEAAPCA